MYPLSVMPTVVCSSGMNIPVGIAFARKRGERVIAEDKTGNNTGLLLSFKKGWVNE